MKIRFDKLLIGSIVAALLIAGGAYFGGRWIYRDLPGDTSKRPTPPTIEKDSIGARDDGGRVSAPSFPSRRSSDDASADSSVLSGEADRVTADLEQTRRHLKAWGDDYLKQFPDVPAVEATVKGLQELLVRVADRNQQLKQEGVPMDARMRELAKFAEKTSDDIVTRRRTKELHIQLLRENTELKLKIDRYMHSNQYFLLFPPYLLGLSEEELHALQHEHHHN
ncbi:MAG: hypothetical protein OXP71_05680 [Candidatus Poribacteria bacterium]|nr:hypothetical protein [Candidatus Poribacteria bacterium]